MAEPTVGDTDPTNKSQGTQGTPLPAPASNEPPAPAGPTAEETAALAAATKLVEENNARIAAAKAAKAPDPDPDPDPDKDKTPDPDDKTDETPLDIDKWGTTGHEGGDAVLGLMQNAGLEPEQAKALLFDAVAEGDLKKVDMGKLIEAVGADKAKLVMIGAENFLSDKATRNTQIVTDLKDVAGGEENWAKVAAWAKDTSDLSDDVLSDYIGMIDEGGPKARYAASELVKAYNASDANTTLDNTPGKADEVIGDTNNTPGGRVLTRLAYSAEVAKAHANGRMPPETELTELSAARARGRAKEQQ